MSELLIREFSRKYGCCCSQSRLTEKIIGTFSQEDAEQYLATRIRNEYKDIPGMAREIILRGEIFFPKCLDRCGIVLTIDKIRSRDLLDKEILSVSRLATG